jgi:hypothetical protein
MMKTRKPSPPLAKECGTLKPVEPCPRKEVRRLLAEVRQADRQVKSGHYIKNEDMKAWLLSWGTDHELLVPKCACGSSEF